MTVRTVGSGMALTRRRLRRGASGRRRAPRSASSMQARIRAASTRTLGSSTIESWSPGTSTTRVAGAQRRPVVVLEDVLALAVDPAASRTPASGGRAPGGTARAGRPSGAAGRAAGRRGTPPRSPRRGTGASRRSRRLRRRGARAAGRAPRPAGPGPSAGRSPGSLAQLLPLDQRAVDPGQLGAHRQRRVEHHEQRDLLAVGLELARHLVGGDAAAGEAAEQVGPVRLHRCGARRCSRRRLPRRSGAAPRRRRGRGPAGRRTAGRCRAGARGGAGSGRCRTCRRRGRTASRAALALVHGDEVLVAPRAPAPAAASAGSSAGGVDAEPLGDQRRAGRDRRRLEQHRDREVDAVGLLDHREQPHRDQRVAAEVEEAVLDADLADAEQLLPEADERPLDVVARLDVGGVEVGPVERLAGLRRGGRASRPAWAISASRSSEETTTCGSPSASARAKASAPSGGRMPCDRLCASRSSAGDSG